MAHEQGTSVEHILSGGADGIGLVRTVCCCHTHCSQRTAWPCAMAVAEMAVAPGLWMKLIVLRVGFGRQAFVVYPEGLAQLKGDFLGIPMANFFSVCAHRRLVGN